jgi:hypothetical protein
VLGLNLDRDTNYPEVLRNGLHPWRLILCPWLELITCLNQEIKQGNLKWRYWNSSANVSRQVNVLTFHQVIWNNHVIQIGTKYYSPTEYYPALWLTKVVRTLRETEVQKWKQIGTAAASVTENSCRNLGISTHQN